MIHLIIVNKIGINVVFMILRRGTKNWVFDYTYKVICNLVYNNKTS